MEQRSGFLCHLSLRNRAEYEQASDAEARLRGVVDTMPGWLYDLSDLGTIIDDLNAARQRYEVAHPDEPRIEL